MKPILRKIFTLIVLGLVFWLLQNNQTLALQRPTPPLKPTPPTKPTPPVFSFTIPCPPKKPTPPTQFRLGSDYKTSHEFNSKPQHPCDLAYTLEEILAPATPPDSNEAWVKTLSQLLVSDITQTFSTESIQSAIEESNEQIGKMTKLELVSDLTLTGDWAQGEFLLKTDQGISQKFLVVFHKENGVWKLFGTQAIE